MDCRHSDDFNKELEKCLQRLKSAELKITKPREAVLKVMVRQRSPQSAEEIFKHARKFLAGSKCDLATVYRSLASFEEAGLATRCEFGDGTTRYELNHGDRHHHHIICKVCHQVEPLDVCVIDAQEQILRRMGYREITHRLEFFGICRSCGNR